MVVISSDASSLLPIVTAFAGPDETDSEADEEMKPVSALHAFGAQPQFDRHARLEGKSDTRRRRKLKEIAKTLPRSPGVYFFYGVNERLLYIGKAKCLRERVGSYFGETSLRRPPKLRRLLAEIKRLEYEECGSELEALLVERRLIAEHLPILNRQHKRFKVYPYLLLSSETFPRLTLTRAEPAEGERADEYSFVSSQSRSTSLPLETAPHAGDLPGLYLGPFTSPRSAYWTFEAVRALFPLRSCEGAIVPDEDARGCFYHEIGRCLGPCVGAVETIEYSNVCADLVQLLQTGSAPQLDAMRLKMQKLSDEWRFEEAAQLKEQLAAIEAVAKRLQRLQRMRERNNVVIVQDARREEAGNAGPQVGNAAIDTSSARPLSTDFQPADSGLTTRSASVFLVQGGVVRRHITVRNWTRDHKTLRTAVTEVFDNPPPVADYTAKTELDEMMILDRWLKSNGDTPCCIWMNDRPSRQWTSNVLRGVQRWMSATE
ncbi:MAG TPA: hypothetical protein VM821_01595 [Abditibacteriaceae bacterium]|nr:hypothetical protein [Abditibacteriaceae bacterium]